MNFPQNIMTKPLKWDISQLYTTYSIIKFGLAELLNIDIHTKFGNVPIGLCYFLHVKKGFLHTNAPTLPF